MAGLLKKLQESFFSKVWEKLVDYGLVTLRGMKEFTFILETLERNLNSLIAKASDVNEQIKNGELSGKRKRKREVDNWLKEVQKIERELVLLRNEVQEEGFFSRFFGEDRAAKLNARVCELVVQSIHFGELLLDAHETIGEPLLTTRLIGEAFEKNIEIVWKWVVIDKAPNIGIYGMGGVGKTTLAKHINNRLVYETQYNVYWITVSQVFAINKLQDDIAKVIGLDLSNEDNEDKRAGRLNRALSQRKNFVLILDDVWADINLEKLGDPLGVEGCRLIVTTRSLNVCRQINCREIVKVEKLQTDEAWNLFKETLGQGTVITSEVQEIAKSLAKECDGLPLGIIVLAGSMKRVTDILEWRNAFVELKESPMEQDDMKDKVFRVLKYSFNRLDPDYHKRRRRKGYTNLQKCFLYCSLYPEDFKIDRDELITQFISEEFVDKRKKRKEQFDQCHTMLNKLVNLCLLESADLCEVIRHEYVKMHDLVRAMAIKIARDNSRFMVLAGLSLKKIPNEEEWAEDLEKMSLMDNHVSEIAPGMSPNCPKLSTLLLGMNVSLEFMPESFFVQMRRLCFLDLSRTSIKKLPSSLSDLESLKALLLKDCSNLVLVPYLGKLKELRELDLSYTGIRRLPQGMENLINLKSLSMYGMHCLKSLPRGLLPRFSNLQRLTLPLHIEICIEEIRCLKQIEEFIGSFRDGCDFNRFTKLHVDLGHPCFYHIQLGPISENSYTDISRDFGKKIDCKKVHIQGCSIKRREGKYVIKLPADVQELDGLSRCLLDDLPLSLKRLKISGCKGIECILTRNEWSMAEENGASHSRYYRLQNLEVLIMRYLPNFISVINWEGRVVAAQSVFSSLKILQISNCNKLKKLGLLVQDLQNIEFLSVCGCDEILEIIDIAEEDRGGIVSLPNLKDLRLDDLPELKNICNGATIACTSISRITLLKCRKVKKLPLFLLPSRDGQLIYSPPPALKEIVTEEEMWESLLWKDPGHKHLLQPFVSI